MQGLQNLKRKQKTNLDGFKRKKIFFLFFVERQIFCVGFFVVYVFFDIIMVSLLLYFVKYCKIIKNF